ncbi:MAG: hypothetical protein ACKOE7_10095, partial [Actinomycetota bacterium]
MQLTLVGGLLIVLQRRIGRDPIGVIADASILALGAWLVMWIFVVRALFDVSGSEPAVVLIKGLTFSLSAIVL